MRQEENKRPSPGLASEPRKNSIKVPEVICQCSSINIMGTRIKSVIFATDGTIIANNNAQAVLCV
ncbi:MAG: hypothetical protein PHP02_09185 [Eubacteriales bacterium]|nr:hypothetical protein [Eubacteriales bacterium]